MAVIKPRERLVYFRISEDEFHQFLSVCEQEGARSISDLARNAVQRLIAHGNQQREDQNLAPKIEMLEKLIAEVSAQLHCLTTLNAPSAAGKDAAGNGNGASSQNPTEKEQYGNPA